MRRVVKARAHQAPRHPPSVPQKFPTSVICSKRGWRAHSAREDTWASLRSYLTVQTLTEHLQQRVDVRGGVCSSGAWGDSTTVIAPYKDLGERSTRSPTQRMAGVQGMEMLRTCPPRARRAPVLNHGAAPHEHAQLRCINHEIEKFNTEDVLSACGDWQSGWRRRFHSTQDADKK